MTKHRRFYAESDGNGGYVISKSFLAGLLALVSLLSVVVSIVAMEVTMKNDINFLKEKTKDIAETQQKNFQEHKEIGATDSKQDEQIAVLSSDLKLLRSDVSEVKGDIKILLQRN